MTEINEEVFSVETQTDEALEHVLATVQTVEPTGLTLIWDGETESDGKIYKCNAYQIFKKDDRVKVAKISGTYVVEYVIGVPGASPEEHGFLPAGGTSGQYLKKSSNADYACEWADVTVSVSGTLPTGGTTGQYLAKSNNTNYACNWVTPPVAGGSTSIGFMNTTAQAKKTVAKCSTSGTLSNAITTINNLLTALAGYGLITSY